MPTFRPLQLTLRPADSARRPACAAFLRGSEAAGWLRELGRWNVSPAEVQCFVVPESVRSVRAAGLLVVRRTGLVPPDCAEPLGVVAGRLFLPVAADLWPATTPEELSALLLWPWQLLHPVIGLVGFAPEDELDLTQLLTCVPPHPTPWDRALTAPAPAPRLRAVRVAPAPATDVMATMRHNIGSQPLADIPKPAAPNPLQRLLDGLGRGALSTGLGVAKGVGALLGGLAGVLGGLAGAGTTSGVGAGAASGPGWLTRVENWLQGNLSDLEAKRAGEVERLLELFGENLEEALKYAIPLAGEYLNRGAAPPSAHLSARNTNFDLGKLGGGGRVDGWNVNQYEQQLRHQYLQAARQEQAAGRFQKAAYIYAHLLADYFAAAKALEQGGYFREAAALHRDHLRNPSAAAACLERGGLLLEAAELYEGLQQHEKAGNLYQQSAQPAAATAQYELAVASAQAAHNHPEAGRLLLHRLAAPDRAREVLLEGWRENRQPEKCLRQYVEVVAEHAAPDLPHELQTLYEAHTPAARRPDFLRVLVSLREQNPVPAVQDTARELAYRIVSAETQAGELAYLPLLAHFQPTDRLLISDTSRYQTNQRRLPEAAPPAAAGPHLNPEIEWFQAVPHRNQFLALGRRDNQLHLARGNWYGHVEYYSWPGDLPPQGQPQLFADAFHSPNVVLFGVSGFAPQYLAKNKHFEEYLMVVNPNLPADAIGLGLLPNDEVVVLTPEEPGLLCQQFTTQGVPQQSLKCVGNSETALDSIHYGEVAPVFSREAGYYTIWEDSLLQIVGAAITMVDVVPMRILQLAMGPNQEIALLTAETLQFYCDEQPCESQLLPYFGGEPRQLVYVGAGRLVVAGGRSAVIFAARQADEVPLQTYTTATPIVAILPTNSRQQFALLEANGHLTRCEIPAE